MKRTDELLLLRLAKVTHRTRAVLCALALRGKALRQEQPEKARCLLVVAAEHAFYRSSRLVFDMAEVAEALRDGPPPAHIDDEMLSQLIRPVAESLDIADVVALCHSVSEGVEGEPARRSEAKRVRTDLPLQEPADALFELIVLGIVAELLRLPGGARSHRPVAELA
ncbi:hypothetical protein [Archangium sp.]|jgi:hypothetical protein|uniref:hypothetical protein n=1 Tax=Archangium sp. TaxID=1872627 RepID=UPI002ED999FA